MPSYSHNFRTPEFRVSYPSLHKKSSYDGSEANMKFSVQMLFDKETVDKAEFDAMLALIESEVAKNFSEQDAKKALARSPLKDGDKDLNAEGKPKNPGFFTMRTSSKQEVKLFGRDAMRITMAEADPSLDTGIYGGCFAKAFITFSTGVATAQKTPYITVYIEAVQKTGDGERFTAGTSIGEGDFDALPDADVVPMDVEDNTPPV